MKLRWYLLVFILSGALVAQPEKTTTSNENKPETSGTFDLTVKRQSATYTPHQHSRTRGWFLYPGSAIYTGKLKGNTDVIYPLSFGYTSAANSWGFNISYFKHVLANTTYDYTYASTGYASPGRARMQALTRTELQANLYKYFSPADWFRIGLGGGVRNINTSQSYDNLYSYEYEYIRAYGPQVSIPLTFTLSPRIELSLIGNAFVARGKRVYEKAIGYDAYIYKSWGPPNVRGLYYGDGYEARVSFRALENLRLSVGYDYTKSIFEYGHYRVISLPYSAMDGFGPQNYPQTDRTQGWYLAASVSF
ncbi:MAG: hypothetical protein K8S54_00450 [Spirochaetia bacterium]|nr:hypothetical protein [Spirochaetia bacterium]